LRIQGLLAPAHVRGLLGLSAQPALRLLLRCYSTMVHAGLRGVAQRLLLPASVLDTARQIDRRARECGAPHATAGASRCPFARTAMARQRVKPR
jgi:hypothetical protein